jgi:hypothetical protein
MAVMTGVALASSPDLWPREAPLSDADYADVFTADPADALEHSPELWARRVLEGASLPMRLFLRLGWRFGLGFPLARDNAVLGWPVVAASSGWVVLEQQSWLFGVALLMRTADGRLTWATRVKYRSPVSRAAWTVVGLLHRRFAPRALRRAARY